MAAGGKGDCAKRLAALAQQRIEDEILVGLGFGGGVFASVARFGRFGLAYGSGMGWGIEWPAHAARAGLANSRLALQRKLQK